MSLHNVLEHTIGSVKHTENQEHWSQRPGELEARVSALLDRNNVVMVGTQGPDGYPNIKAMFKIEAEGIHTLWFSTNTSSKRVTQLRENPRACIYIADHNSVRGLMLTGEIEILTDMDSRQRLWKDGCEIYYPQGVSDPDYSVLRFTARKGNYYEGLRNFSFDVV